MGSTPNQLNNICDICKTKINFTKIFEEELILHDHERNATHIRRKQNDVLKQNEWENGNFFKSSPLKEKENLMNHHF